MIDKKLHDMGKLDLKSSFIMLLLSGYLLFLLLIAAAAPAPAINISVLETAVIVLIRNGTNNIKCSPFLNINFNLR